MTPHVTQHKMKCVAPSWESRHVTADLDTAAVSTESHAEVSHAYLYCLHFFYACFFNLECYIKF